MNHMNRLGLMMALAGTILIICFAGFGFGVLSVAPTIVGFILFAFGGLFLIWEWEAGD